MSPCLETRLPLGGNGLNVLEEACSQVKSSAPPSSGLTDPPYTSVVGGKVVGYPILQVWDVDS